MKEHPNPQTKKNIKWKEQDPQNRRAIAMSTISNNMRWSTYIKQINALPKNLHYSALSNTSLQQKSIYLIIYMYSSAPSIIMYCHMILQISISYVILYS